LEKQWKVQGKKLKVTVISISSKIYHLKSKIIILNASYLRSSYHFTLQGQNPRRAAKLRGSLS